MIAIERDHLLVRTSSTSADVVHQPSTVISAHEQALPMPVDRALGHAERRGGSSGCRAERLLDLLRKTPTRLPSRAEAPLGVLLRALEPGLESCLRRVPFNDEIDAFGREPGAALGRVVAGIEPTEEPVPRRALGARHDRLEVDERLSARAGFRPEPRGPSSQPSSAGSAASGAYPSKPLSRCRLTPSFSVPELSIGNTSMSRAGPRTSLLRRKARPSLGRSSVTALALAAINPVEAALDRGVVGLGVLVEALPEARRRQHPLDAKCGYEEVSLRLLLDGVESLFPVHERPTSSRRSGTVRMPSHSRIWRSSLSRPVIASARPTAPARVRVRRFSVVRLYRLEAAHPFHLPVSSLARHALIRKSPRDPAPSAAIRSPTEAGPNKTPPSSLDHRSWPGVNLIGSPIIAAPGPSRVRPGRPSSDEVILPLAVEVGRIGIFQTDFGRKRTRFSPELCGLLGLPIGTIMSYAEVLTHHS